MEKIEPCFDCGSPDINIWDCGYSSFNIGGGTCKKCGRKISGSVGWNDFKKDSLELWNNANGLVHLLSVKIDELSKLHLAIQSIKDKIEVRKLKD